MKVEKKLRNLCIATQIKILWVDDVTKDILWEGDKMDLPFHYARKHVAHMEIHDNALFIFISNEKKWRKKHGRAQDVCKNNH